jgi:O-antigen ligase
MKQAWPRIEPNRDHLHANWAQVLVETGWPGVSVFLLWMVGGIILAVRTLLVARKGGALERVVAPVIVLMLAGLILNGFVEYNFGDTELMFIYAVVLGLTTGFWRGGATHAERTEFSQVET